MQIVSAEFVKGAVKPEHYPETELCEVAFAGRSNVGKSSLINTLVNRHRLVKTSSTPGRTQEINFFEINHRLMFVDLPGYGFARAPGKVREAWGPMIETYITTRPPLKAVVTILDIRHKPTGQDIQLLQWLVSTGVVVVPVLTKADKLSKTQQKAQLKVVCQHAGLAPEDAILFSAESRLGRGSLWERLLQICDAADMGDPHSQL